MKLTRFWNSGCASRKRSKAEAADDVLARFGAVHPENRVLVPVGGQVSLVGARLLAVGGFPDRLGIDRDRIGPDLGGSPVPRDALVRVVDRAARHVCLA